MINIENAWQIICKEANILKQSKEPFDSPRNKVRYRIKDVTNDTITVQTKSEDKSFGPDALKNQLQLLNDSNGKLHYRKFFQNVAKGTAVVRLHPRLAWDRSCQYVIDLDSQFGVG